MSGTAAMLPERRSIRSRTTGHARYYLPAGLVFVAVLATWEVLVKAANLQAFVLPRPSMIATALVENWGAGRWPLFSAGRATLVEAVGGLSIGVTAGVAIAFITSRWGSARDILVPVAVGASAVPIIAFAPLMNNWFGPLNPLSKMMMAAVLVFFPVYISVTRGLVNVDATALELMRSYAASEWTILRRVRIPNALPFFFTSLKVATTLSLIGAIVGEYFGGSSDVLGRVIVQSASSLRFDVTWAAIVLGATTGIVFYLAVALVERIAIPWHASFRTSDR